MWGSVSIQEPGRGQTAQQVAVYRTYIVLHVLAADSILLCCLAETSSCFLFSFFLFLFLLTFFLSIFISIFLSFFLYYYLSFYLSYFPSLFFSCSFNSYLTSYHPLNPLFIYFYLYSAFIPFIFPINFLSVCLQK